MLVSQREMGTPVLVLLALACGTLALAQTPAIPGSEAAAEAKWEADRRLTRNPAQAVTSINFARSVAADNRGRVHLVWVDVRDRNEEIYYKRSIDGGVSWGPPVRLTNDTAESRNPSIAVSGDAVHVVWWDTRSGFHQVYHKRSLDGGVSWEPDQQIIDSPGGSAHPSLAMSGLNLHVAYVDGREGQSEVFYTRSLDQGDTWQPPVRLSALPANSYTPTVAVWGSNVYVAWTDTRHGGAPDRFEEEYFRRSTDHGATWDPEVRLTDDPANSWAPSLAARGADVWITWFDERHGDWEIFTKHSGDRGATWSSDRRLTFAAGTSVRPSLAVAGREVYAAYWNSHDGNNAIYVLASPDRGQTWLEPQRLTMDPRSSVRPSLAAAPSGVHVVWQEGRDGNSEIYYKRLAGEPVPVGNGLIAFTRGSGPSRQIFTFDQQTGADRQLTFEGENNFPAWSKDGSQIIYSSNRSGSFELWQMDAEGSNQRQLTLGTPGGNFVPAWSHDGTRIAFASVRNNVGHPEVWVMNADGSEQNRLTETPRESSGPTWSLHATWEPGDQRIYYASTASGRSQIWGMFADGRGKEQKTRGLGTSSPDANVPEFARSGRKLVFWSGFEQRFGEVWSWDLDDPAGPQRLTETQDPHSSDNPAWSPDGTKILFDTNRSRTAVEIWVMDADGTNPRPLLGGRANGQSSWQPVTLERITSVSAASFEPALAPGAIASAFSSDLATSTSSATTVPLPTELAGTRLRITDSVGVERLAPLFFVSPEQVNFLVPPESATGSATVRATTADGRTIAGWIELKALAPGIFSANADGHGLAAAQVVYTPPVGPRRLELTFRFDETTGRNVTVPISLGDEATTVALELFGTGFGATSSIGAVEVTIGREPAEVLFAGQQGEFAGLDQINVIIPQSLRGRGQVDVQVTVDDVEANPVQIYLQQPERPSPNALKPASSSSRRSSPSRLPSAGHPQFHGCRSAPTLTLKEALGRHCTTVIGWHPGYAMNSLLGAIDAGSTLLSSAFPNV